MEYDGLTAVIIRFGKIDVKLFIEQAMRLSGDPTQMPTVIGTASCDGEDSPLVEWKVGLPRSGASPPAYAGVLGWVAVASVAIVLATA